MMQKEKHNFLLEELYLKQEDGSPKLEDGIKRRLTYIK